MFCLFHVSLCCCRVRRTDVTPWPVEDGRAILERTALFTMTDEETDSTATSVSIQNIAHRPQHYHDDNKEQRSTTTKGCHADGVQCNHFGGDCGFISRIVIHNISLLSYKDDTTYSLSPLPSKEATSEIISHFHCHSTRPLPLTASPPTGCFGLPKNNFHAPKQTTSPNQGLCFTTFNIIPEHSFTRQPS